MRLENVALELLDSLFYVIRQENEKYSIMGDPITDVVFSVDPAKIYNSSGESYTIMLTKYYMRAIIESQECYFPLNQLADTLLNGKENNTNYYFVGLQFRDIKLKEIIKQELVKGNKKYIEYCINWPKKLNLLTPESKGCYNIRKVIDYIDQDISDRTDSQEDYDKIMDKEVIAKLKTYMKLKQENLIEAAPISEITDIRKLLQDYNNPIVEGAISNPIVLRQ